MATNTSEKITNRIALAYAVKLIQNDDSWSALYDPDEIVAKLNKMIDQLDKKNAAPKKMTERQEKNETVKADILAYLTENSDSGYTVSDLLKVVPSLDGDSNQHASALLRALVLAGSVTKYTEKRRTYFKAA